MSEGTADALILKDFAANAARLPGAGLPWLDALRASAIESFRASGVPHRRIEDWKYSDLRNALSKISKLDEFDVGHWEIEGLPETVELFDLSRLDDGAPDWVIERLGRVSQNRSAMDAASLALVRSGVAIRVPAYLTITTPVSLRYSSSGHMRVLIVVENGASIVLSESDDDEYGVFRNVGSEYVIGRNAKLTHIRTTDRPEFVIVPTGVLVNEIAVRVAGGGVYCAHFMSVGAKFSRVEVEVTLQAERAYAELSGVGVLASDAHADVTTHVVHAAPNTCSMQLFKDIAGGRSRAVYQGKITVAAGADGSDSRQTAKGLLLEPLLGQRAEIDLKPELEIFADDVKCAHGAAVGDLDVESLFYLRSRGIPDAEARALLMRAFLGDAVDEIENEDIRAFVWAKVEAALLRWREYSP